MVDARGHESIILSPAEQLLLQLRWRNAVIQGNRGEADRIEHQLALSRFYERLRDQERSGCRRRDETTESFGTISLRRAA